MSDATSLSFDIYLRATPQRVRAVLADPEFVPCWLGGLRFQPDAAEDARRLTCEWLQTDHLDSNGGAVSVARFELVAMGEVTRMTVTHCNLIPGESLLRVVTPGWPMILSSIKSLVETGSALEFRRSA